MSGYSSVKEAQDVLRQSIPHNADKLRAKGLSTAPEGYYMGRVYSDLIAADYPYGAHIDYSEDNLYDSLRRNVRPNFKREDNI